MIGMRVCSEDAPAEFTETKRAQDCRRRVLWQLEDSQFAFSAAWIGESLFPWLQEADESSLRWTLHAI